MILLLFCDFSLAGGWESHNFANHSCDRTDVHLYCPWKYNIEHGSNCPLFDFGKFKSGILHTTSKVGEKDYKLDQQPAQRRRQKRAQEWGIQSVLPPWFACWTNMHMHVYKSTYLVKRDTSSRLFCNVEKNFNLRKQMINSLSSSSLRSSPTVR